MSISLNCAGTRAYLINTCTIYDKTKFSPFAYMHRTFSWTIYKVFHTEKDQYNF